MTEHNWPRINREIAKALEPDGDIRLEDPICELYQHPTETPLKLWHRASSAARGFLPVSFHIDGNAMLALIEAFTSDTRKIGVDFWADRWDVVARARPCGTVIGRSTQQETMIVAVTLAIADALGIETEGE